MSYPKSKHEASLRKEVEALQHRHRTIVVVNTPKTSRVDSYKVLAQWATKMAWELVKARMAWQAVSRDQADSIRNKTNHNRHLQASAIPRLSHNRALPNATQMLLHRATKTIIVVLCSNLVLALTITLRIMWGEACATRGQAAGPTTREVVTMATTQLI